MWDTLYISPVMFSWCTFLLKSGKSFRKLEESVSQLSLDSQDTAPTADNVDTGEKEKKEGAGNIDPASSQELDNNGQLNTIARNTNIIIIITNIAVLNAVHISDSCSNF